MFDPNRPNEPEDQPRSSDQRPVARDFGELSGGYRARWTASHPDMQRQWPGNIDSGEQLRALLGATGTDQRPDAEPSGAGMPGPHV